MTEKCNHSWNDLGPATRLYQGPEYSSRFATYERICMKCSELDVYHKEVYVVRGKLSTISTGDVNRWGKIYG